MLCRAIPYEGRDPYIFFSYSHKDAARVYPLLEQMVRDGYRVWYDDGNHPGDDWLENIGQHLNNCHLCLAMMSQNSEESHNCKKEVSFAVQCKKKLMAVMLEQFAMTVGMRLQLSTIHYLLKTDYPSDKALLEKLYETDSMQACRAMPGSLRMRDVPVEDKKVLREEKKQDALAAFVSSTVALEPEKQTEAEAGEQSAVEEKGKSKTLKIKAKVKPPKKEKTPEKTAITASVNTVSAENNVESSEFMKVPLRATDDKDETSPVVEDQHIEEADEVVEKERHEEETAKPAEAEQVAEGSETNDEEVPVTKEETTETNRQVLSDGKKVLLVRMTDGSSFVLDKALIHIGRSEKRCDIVLKNNHLISNHHASIVVDDGDCYLQDAGSSNGTFVNGERLQPGVRVRLGSVATFQICKEDFLLFYDVAVEKCQADRRIVYLLNPATQNVRILNDEVFLLDRQHKWEDGSLSNGNISRKHARICPDEKGYYLEDLDSKNGTYCNEQRISPQNKQRLVNGDRIRLVDTVLEFNIVTF